jgi:hypothetical protein
VTISLHPLLTLDNKLLAFSGNKIYTNRGTSHTNRVIMVKIAITINCPIRFTDETPISFPASIISFFKNIKYF